MKFLTGLVSKVSSKMLWAVVLVLSTLLVTKTLTLNDITKQLSVQNEQVVILTGKVNRINDENQKLRDELRNQPEKVVTITKDVTREVCNGKVLESQILNLPPTKQRGANHAANDQTSPPVADLDDRLPDDLVRLLNKAQ